MKWSYIVTSMTRLSDSTALFLKVWRWIVIYGENSWQRLHFTTLASWIGAIPAVIRWGASRLFETIVDNLQWRTGLKYKSKTRSPKKILRIQYFRTTANWRRLNRIRLRKQCLNWVFQVWFHPKRLFYTCNWRQLVRTCCEPPTCEWEDELRNLRVVIGPIPFVLWRGLSVVSSKRQGKKVNWALNRSSAKASSSQKANDDKNWNEVESDTSIDFTKMPLPQLDTKPKSALQKIKIRALRRKKPRKELSSWVCEIQKPLIIQNPTRADIEPKKQLIESGQPEKSNVSVPLTVKSLEKNWHFSTTVKQRVLPNLL